MQSKTKVEIGAVVIILGWICTAGIRAVQTETKVEEHDAIIKILSSKIDQISIDSSYIRGKLSIDNK